MPTTDLATDLHKQADAATHGYATKSWLSRVAGDDDGRFCHPSLPPTVAEAIQGCGIGYNRTQWATVENRKSKKLEKLLGAAKPYALGVLGGLALAALARR